MYCILRTALAITIVVGFGGTHASKALWACGGACSEGGGHSNQESSDHTIQAKAEVKGEKAEAIKDPVCGMEVSDIKKASSEEYNGKVYYFCSEHCKKTFKKDPAPYVVKETHQHDEGEGHKH